MLTIDPRYHDVDFSRVPPVFGRGFAGIGEVPATFRAFEDSGVKLLTRAEAKEAADEMQAKQTGLSWSVVEVKNQLQEGSCVGNMIAQIHQILQAKQYGAHRVTLVSAISAYKQIGSSPNSGANIADALEMSRKVGMLPLDNEPNRAQFGGMVMPATGFYTRWPAGDWKATAQLIRVDEYETINTLEGMWTALCNDYPVGVGRNGHSIPYIEPFFTSGNTFNALYPNSWGKWGRGAGNWEYGFGTDSENTCRQSARWCFCCRSVYVPAYQLL